MAMPTSTGVIAPDTKGQSFFSNDRSLQNLARLYLDDALCDVASANGGELGSAVADFREASIHLSL